jgi:Tfp pilus assembly protein PilE
MSTETIRRIKSSLVMFVVLLVVGLGAVVADPSFRPFLLENGLSGSLATLITVFLYQVVAYLSNKFSVQKQDQPVAAGKVSKTDLSLI